MSRPDADFFSLSQLYKCLLAALAMAAFTLAAPAPALADGIVATDACGLAEPSLAGVNGAVLDINGAMHFS